MVSFLPLRSGVTPRVSVQLATVTLAAAWLFGGATRFDVLSPIVPLAVAIGTLAFLFLLPGRPSLSRTEKVVWGILFAIPAIQLIPLPMAVWSKLPAHQYPRDLFHALGETTWAPWSMTPSRTISSGFGMVPAFATYLAARELPVALGNRLLKLLALFAVISVILGLFQLAGGTASILRFYAITNSDAAVGFFSNANHFGSFVAACVPISAYLLLQVKRRRGETLRTPIFISVSIAALLLLGAVASFSRAGIAFAGLSIPLVTMMILARLALSTRAKVLIAVGVVLAIAACSILVMHWYGLHESDVESVTTDGRFALIPTFLRMIAASFPFGTGLGSFDPMYRSFEDYRQLDFNYLNNAHNDLAQIVIEAGIFGAIALIAWLLFIARRLRTAMILADTPEMKERGIALGFAIFVLLAHSLVDYPLRSAAGSASLALLVGLLGVREGDRARAASRAARNDSLQGGRPGEGN